MQPDAIPAVIFKAELNGATAFGQNYFFAIDYADLSLPEGSPDSVAYVVFPHHQFPSNHIGSEVFLALAPDYFQDGKEATVLPAFLCFPADAADCLVAKPKVRVATALGTPKLV